MPKLFKFLAVVLALPLVLTGCKIKSINYFPPTPAQVRIVNVLQSTTPVNVTVNDVATWSNLGFEAMTGFQEFTNASTKFSVTLVGATTPLVEQTFNLGGKQNYTLVIYGTTYAPQIGAMADVTEAPPSGQSEMNVFMAAPIGNGVAVGPYPIDIYVIAPSDVIDGINPTFTTVQYNFTNIFGQFSSGPHRIVMTVAATKTIVYDSGPITLDSATATDLIVYSRGSTMLPNLLRDDSDGAAQQIVINNSLARIKVVNSAFQTGAVNQFLNGNAGAANLAYGTASSYAIIPAGAGTVTFEATAAPGATIASLANPFTPATDQSIFVTGFAGATTAVALLDDNTPPLNNYAAVRIVNTSPDSPPLNVFLTDTTSAVTGLAANTASTYLQLVPGAQTFVFRDSTTGTTVLTLTNVALSSAQTYSIYVQGPAGALTGLVTPDTP
jgi:Domain of unknown function (DUF4397)